MLYLSLIKICASSSCYPSNHLQINQRSTLEFHSTASTAPFSTLDESASVSRNLILMDQGPHQRHPHKSTQQEKSHKSECFSLNCKISQVNGGSLKQVLQAQKKMVSLKANMPSTRSVILERASGRNVNWYFMSSCLSSNPPSQSTFS